MRKISMRILSVMLLATMLFTACGKAESEAAASSTNGGESTQTTGGLDVSKEETLKIFIPGDRPVAFDKVISQVEAQIKDTINVKLDVVFVPWSDLGTKTTQTLNSGEKCDLIFDAPWNGMSNNIGTGFYAPLEDLLEQYGQNILATTPKEMFDANKFQNTVYGIPLGQMQKAAGCYVVRKDIREALGIPEIKSYAELEKFMYAVKEKYPTMVPYLPQNAAGNDRGAAMMRLYFENPEQIERTEAFGTSHVLYFKNNDGKVYNLFDNMEPVIWDYIENAKKLYDDGIIYKDMLAVTDIYAEAKKGNVAVYPLGDLSPTAADQAAIKSINPDYEFESVQFYSTTPKEYVSDFKQWNFICVPEASKLKERAIMFLDWVRADQKNYDLLAYGIEGETFEIKPDGTYSFLNADYSWFPYNWIWNPAQERISADYSEEARETYKFFCVASNFESSKLLGFTFDATNVTNEISQFNSIEGKYYTAIINGIVDPTAEWEKFKAEASGVTKVIQEEYQKQIDAFLASK